MSNRAAAALSRHVRFYIAFGCGLLALLLGRIASRPVALLAAGDVFYLVFLGLCLLMIAGQTSGDLKRRAKSEDEGIGVVIGITLATIVFFIVAVFEALNAKHAVPIAPLILAALGAPLGWLVLHTVMAFHYADLHYFEDPDAPGRARDLNFPGGYPPGPWDFLYFSFVIGMTNQVSDVAITTTAMRRAVLGHSVISFFFNTVFIAMAVNAAVSMAS
jgi:uncharacterized membrane protein